MAGSALVAGTPAQAATAAEAAPSALAAPAAQAVPAAQGLMQGGRARFVVSAVGAPIQVEQLLYLTNLAPPTSKGSTVRTGYALWLPDGGSGLRASSGGESLAVSVARVGEEQFARITFPEPLRYGYSRELRVTYTIKGGSPRAKARARVGKGYAAFDVYSPGDAGMARVELVAPTSREAARGRPAEDSEDAAGDLRTTVAVGGGPFGLWSRASLRDPAQATTSTVTVGDGSFDVVGFPGDKAWAAHIANRLPATIRALEELSGQPWPNRQTTITEDLSGEVYGWAGSYDEGDIRVSEDLDPALLAHELSHAFANFDNLAERWLTEGLAQELATQISAATSVKDRPHPTVRPSQAGAFPLAEWPGSFGVATRSEAYGYPAAWRAMHALMEGGTPASRPALVRALTTKATVYDAPGDITTAGRPSTWRQAYDLFDVVGKNPQTRSVMTTWVIGAKDAKAIPARTAARTAYAEADELDGEWSLPLGVRTPMTDWDFTAATAAMTRVHELAAPAVRAQRVGAETGLSTTELRTAYQVANEPYEYQQVAAQLATFVGQARAYETVRSQVRKPGLLTRLGATVASPDQAVADAGAAIEDLQFTEAESAMATARDNLHTARLVGTGIVGGAFVVLLLLVLTAVVVWRRQAPRPDLVPHQPDLVAQQPAWDAFAVTVAPHDLSSAHESGPVTPGGG
jgi:hypothetical protein